MNLFETIEAIDTKLREGAKSDSLSAAERAAVTEVIEQLDQGKLRVCEKRGDEWIVNASAKKAITLYLRLQNVSLIRAGDLVYCDKVPTKQWTGQEGVRVVPQAIARKGSFVESGAILMPSYVNIGAYVGRGTMVDTWATVGSCAQIGQHVHLSGGVGVGGVLEPAQAKPVVIEDHVFVGSRCILVEGVHIDEGAVLAAGVTLTATTKIIDVTGSEPKITSGYVPKNCVVIPGTTEKKFAAGTYGVPCALIIGQRKPSTDLKTSLNDAIREFQLSV